MVQVYEDDEEEDGDLAKEYGVTDFPAIVLVDTATKKNKPIQVAHTSTIECAHSSLYESLRCIISLHASD